MNYHILELTETCRLAKKDTVRYKVFSKKVGRECDLAEWQYLDQKCDENEQLESQHPEECHKNFGEIRVKKTAPSSSGVQQKRW